MEGWGLNPSTFSAIGSIAVFIALIGLVLGVINETKARNLQAILHISDNMRQRWETSWRAILRNQAPRLNLEDRHKGEVGLQLTYMLNWLDWMGLIMRKKWIVKDVLFGSLATPIQEILKVTAHQIQTDVDAKGVNYWGNVLWVAKQGEIRIDMAKEAYGLRQKWLYPADAADGEEHKFGTQ